MTTPIDPTKNETPAIAMRTLAELQGRMIAEQAKWFEAELDACPDEASAAAKFGLPDPTGDELAMEIFPTRLALFQISLTLVPGLASPGAGEMERLTSGAAPRSIEIEHSAEGVIAKLFADMPKLAGAYFAKPGAVEAALPSASSLELRLFEDGSMLINSKPSGGNAAELRRDVLSLARDPREAMDASEFDELARTMRAMALAIAPGERSERARAAIDGLIDQSILAAIQLSSQRVRMGALTAAPDASLLASKLAGMAALGPSKFPAEAAAWLPGVTRVALDGRPQDNPSRLLAALARPRPGDAPPAISLEEALARRRSQPAQPPDEPAKPPRRARG